MDKYEHSEQFTERQREALRLNDIYLRSPSEPPASVTAEFSPEEIIDTDITQTRLRLKTRAIHDRVVRFWRYNREHLYIPFVSDDRLPTTRIISAILIGWQNRECATSHHPIPLWGNVRVIKND